MTRACDDSQEILVPKRSTLAGFTDETSLGAGVDVAGLSAITRLSVRTRNTLYRLTVLDPEEWQVLVLGGRFFPTERVACLCGSGYGGTLLKVAWVGVGMCCEFSYEGQRVITSPVEEFEILPNALPGPF